MKILFAITLLAFLIQSTTQTGTFQCTYVKGDQEITRTELTEKQKTNCRLLYSSCACSQIDTTCTFGPTAVGEVSTSVVGDEHADTCPRDFCTCTSHDDYHATRASRTGEESSPTESARPLSADGAEEAEGNAQAGESASGENTAGGDKTFSDDFDIILSDDDKKLGADNNILKITDTKQGKEDVSESEEDGNSGLYTAITTASIAVILLTILAILYVIYLFKVRDDKLKEAGKQATNQREAAYRVDEGEGRDGDGESSKIKLWTMCTF